jgi:hypothetical protein
MIRLAKKMMQSGMVGYAIVLFSECGELQPIRELLRDAGEIEQMTFLNDD